MFILVSACQKQINHLTEEECSSSLLSVNLSRPIPIITIKMCIWHCVFSYFIRIEKYCEFLFIFLFRWFIKILSNMSMDKNRIATSEDFMHSSTFVYSIILPPGRCTKRFLNIIDTFISLLLVTPLVVAHWKGTWVFMDNHKEYFPPWETFILGGFVHLTMVLLRELVHRKLTHKDGERTRLRRIIKFLSTKIYLYVFSVGCILNWRGGWAVLEMYWGILI